MTPATGVMWMKIRGALGSGMVIQPTLTRTFDRLEVQADYLIANWTDLDRAGTIDRPELSLGLNLRMLSDLDDREPQRILFGMELGVRLTIVPRTDGDPDLGCVVAFGVPLGR